MEKLIACIIIITVLGFIDYILFLLFSTLFTLTGLSREKSRTQTLAMLTMCGYSTKESELIINYRLRRKIANVCIIVGYVMSILITSVTLGVIATLDFSGEMADRYFIRLLITLGISLSVLAGFILLTRVKPLRKFFFNILKKMLYGKALENRNLVIFGDYSNENFYATVYLHHVPSILQNRPIKDINFHAVNITVLSIVLPDGTGTDCIDDIVLQPDSKLDVFGDPKVIKRLFEKK